MMQSPSVLALRQSHAKAEPVKARPVKAGPVKAGPVKTNARVNAKIERRVFMAFTPLAVDLKSGRYTAFAGVGSRIGFEARREIASQPPDGIIIM
jgi:hypothetical protein